MRANLLRSLAVGALAYLLVPASIASDGPRESAPLATILSLLPAAEAATLTPAQIDVHEVRCDKSYELQGVRVAYASRELSGASPQSIGRVTVVAHLVGSHTSGPPGFDYQVVRDGIYAKDGAVAVSCGLESYAKYDRIWLVMPRSYKLDPDRSSPW